MTAFVDDFETTERFGQFLNCVKRQNLEQFASFQFKGTKLVQLSSGPFSGTALNADFPLFSVLLECCNQDIEKEVHLGDDELAFTIIVPPDRAEAPCDVLARERDCVIVQTPRCKSVSILPSDRMQLTIKVDSSAFLDNRFQSPEMRSWLNQSIGKVELLRSERYVSRLCDVARTALEISRNDETQEGLEVAGKSFVLGLVSALTLEWFSKQFVPTYRKTQAYNCFQTARDILLDGIGKSSDPWSHGLNRLGSRRTVEKAFSKLIRMGPTMYARVLRLNNARRKILDDANTGKSIGDIAAEEGFWDWSRFTAYYRKQFGELPSVTRSEFLHSKGCK